MAFELSLRAPHPVMVPVCPTKDAAELTIGKQAGGKVARFTYISKVNDNDGFR